MAVIEKAGVFPLRATGPSFAREGWDLSGFDPDCEGYDEEDDKISHLWGEDEAAAKECGGWLEERMPEGGHHGDCRLPSPEEGDDHDEEEEMRRLLTIRNQSASA